MELRNATYWWTRRCGGRDVLRLALPLVVSTASLSVMYFIDRMFLLWHSTEAIAAAMPASMLFWSMLCLPVGLASYVNTFVAQYYGAGRPERIGAAMGQALRIGLYATPLSLAAIPLGPAVFRLAGHAPEVVCLESVYFQVLCFGGGGVVLSAALSAFFTGRGETSVVMWVNCAAVVVNLVLDYAWIFGHWGLPAWGIEGAGWATVIAQWFKVLAYAGLMTAVRYRTVYGLSAGRRFDAALMRRLLWYGGPNGLQMLVDVSAGTLFILMVGRLGEEAMAATTVAFNINSVAFVPMIGMSIAVSTMVGQQLGRDRPRLAARATWTALMMAMLYMGTMALAYVLVPDWFMAGHAAGMEAAAFARLRGVTVVLLRFVAAYCLLDGMYVVFVGALKGAGDTRFILGVNLIASPMPVLAGWVGITYFGLGLLWCWVVVTAWICSLGLVFAARFLQGRWREMRVVEPELPEAAAPPPVPVEAAVDAAAADQGLGVNA